MPIAGPAAQIGRQQNDLDAIPVEYVSGGGGDRRPHLVRDASDEQRHAKPRRGRARHGWPHREARMSRDETQTGDE
ncbi:MAG TPA: hypothetical protein VFO62_04715, partial [Candidatus Binatia bacterium]|nr:hypothetical protein [Candidatus Binatia bacterium]